MARPSPLVFLKHTYLDWRQDHPDLLAGALSYYALLSLTPLMIILIDVLNHVIAPDLIHAQLHLIMGEQGAELAYNWVTATQGHGVHGIAGFSILLLLYGASGAFIQMQSSLYLVWKIPLDSSWSALSKRSLRSLVMILAAGLFILLSVAFSACLALILRFMRGTLPADVIPARGVNLASSFVLMTLVFALLYKELPPVRLRWRDVWPGSALISLLFAGAKAALGLYFRSHMVDSLYGAAGSLFAIMIWIYLSAQLFFYGAVFVRAYAQEYGSLAPAQGT